MFKHIYQINEQAFIIDFGSIINTEINDIVINYHNYILSNIDKIKSLGIKNCVPSYNKILIQFDPFLKNKSKILKYLNSIKIKDINDIKNNKIIKIPICYDEEYAIDLNDVSKKTKLSKNQIIDIHLNTIFHVFMIGFMPGLPFLGILDKKLSVLRKSSPRVNVEKGSVAIADKMCVIYPNNSPGGWNIIGKTPLDLFNKNKKNPLLIKPGNKVQFHLINKKDFLLYDK